MATTHNVYVADGTTAQFSVSFPFLDKTHVAVLLNGVEASAYEWVSTSTIDFTVAPTAGVIVRIERNTPIDEPLVVYALEGSEPVEDINLSETQLRYAIQELTRTVGALSGGGIGDPGDTAEIVGRISVLEAATGALQAAVTDEAHVRAEGISALAEMVTTVETAVGETSAAVSEAMTSIDGLQSQWVVEVSSDGLPEGMVALTGVKQADGSTVSELVFMADRLTIRDPDAEDGDPGFEPFVFEGGTAYIDSVKARDIEAETITVDMISGGAVGSTGAVGISGAVSIGHGNTQTVASKLFTPQGGIVKLQADFRAQIDTGVTMDSVSKRCLLTLTFKRGTSTLRTVTVPLNARAINYSNGLAWIDTSIAMGAIDSTPGSVATTYSLDVSVDSTFTETHSVQIQNRNFEVRNTPKEGAQ